MRDRVSLLSRACCGRLVRIAALVLALGLPACALLVPPPNDYADNREVLAAASDAAGFDVDASAFALRGVDIEQDTATFFYAGVEDPYAEAWVLRFAMKPSEQDPPALADVYQHLPLIRELRSGFELGDEGQRDEEAGRLQWVSYSFDSELRDDSARPLVGRGVVATRLRETSSGRLVYAIHWTSVVSPDLEEDAATAVPPLESIAPFLAAAEAGG